MKMKCKAFIVIDGTDGSGKSTQTKALVDCLKNSKYAEKYNFVYIHFPNYDDYSGQTIKAMLNGKYGNSADDVNMYAASMMYTVDRYTALHGDYAKYFNDPNTIIISDRYVSSNLIHQGAKIAKDNTDTKIMALSTELNKYCEWLYELEFDRCKLPEPTKTIYITVHPEVSMERMSNKEKDIHEQLDFIKRTYYVGKYYSHYLNWTIIDGNKNRTEVFKNLFDEVLNIIREGE